MRSKIVIVATVVASLVLAAQMAAADQVQEQLRLMEQRMAEMEDRLQATSEELQSAKATVDEQQGLLSDAGLVEEKDEGVRAGVGKFLEQVDISGVMAASYNYRFMGSGDNNTSNVGLFRHMNANTFSFDQFWMTLDKSPTDEDRAGMHVELVAGETANNQFSNTDSNSLGVYTAYASYLAPLGSGVQVDAGKLATPLGAEVLQTNKNFNITQGLVWGLQPVTHVGVQASGQVSDEVGLTFGIVNDVYSDTSIDDSRDKAYYGQVAYSTDGFGVSVGNIIGKNSSGGLGAEGGGTCDSGDECKTNVFNIVATADPADNVSLWLDYTWARNFGDDIINKGDAHGIAVAGRWGVTEKTGISSRIEYVLTDQGFNKSFEGGSGEIIDIVSATLTGDHALTDCLTFRLEGRIDTNLSNSQYFANGSSNGTATDNTSSREHQFVGLAELYYEF
jgi:hypothetical protein